MSRNQAAVLMAWISCLCAMAQPSTPAQTPDQGADATQSFISPFGLGTGATLAVTSKGASVTAAVEQQMVSQGLNFWQVGISGTTDKNGQAQLFSSQDTDAPGFKGKFGMGKSSFIRKWSTYTETAGDFLRQAWCRDLLTVVNKSMKSPASIPGDADCSTAVPLVAAAVAKSPPSDQKVKDLDNLVMNQLNGVMSKLTMDAQIRVCDALKAQDTMYSLCADSGKVQKSPEDQRKSYPELYRRILSGEPGKFQWKAWGSWAPTLTSVNYRAVNNGVPDLATKHEWTQLLNSGLGDVALYYGKLAFGVEGGFGQTVQVSTENVCNTTTSGSYTAQQCDMAMIGKPVPKNAWMSSASLQLNPLPALGKGSLLSPGFQAVFSYVAPTGGGHSSELALPFYLAPTVAPMKFVVGIQPTWDWNTNPKIGNKFTIALFVGARPEITK